LAAKIGRFYTHPVEHALSLPDEPIVDLRPDQQALHEALAARDAGLAGMYLGALATLANSGNPDRIAQCAHSLRELLEKLPSVLGVGAAPLFQAISQVNTLEATLLGARQGECWRDGAWEGQIDDRTRVLLTTAESIVVSRQAFVVTRRESIRATIRELEPLKRPVPAAAADMTIRQWMDARDYFTRVSHHNSTEEARFIDRLAGFESLLLTQLRPRPFADFDEIDALVSEVEGAD
jgi:hypothetical protein